MRAFDEFKTALAFAESSGRYDAKNRFGFLGRYQFGMPRLCDLGLTVRAGKGQFAWIEGLDELVFLGSPRLQDKTFEVHVGMLRAVVEARYAPFLGKTLCGVVLTLSGAVAVCHLLGEGGLKALTQGIDRCDALGTKASSYARRFAGYDLSGPLLTRGEFHPLAYTREKRT